MPSKLIFESELEPIFLGKFPPFTEEIKEFIVRYGPYLILFFAVLGLFGVLAAFGIGSFAFVMGAMPLGTGFVYYTGLVLYAIYVIINILAFTPLKNRKREGWNLMYTLLLISLALHVLQLQILTVVVQGIVGFWVLFQIREKYIF